VCGDTLQASGRLANSPRSFLSDPLPVPPLPAPPLPAELPPATAAPVAPICAAFVAAAPLLWSAFCPLLSLPLVLPLLPPPLLVSRPWSAREPTCAAFVAAAPLAAWASGRCPLPLTSSSARRECRCGLCRSPRLSAWQGLRYQHMLAQFTCSSGVALVGTLQHRGWSCLLHSFNC
jgi:hypothetical protein